MAVTGQYSVAADSPDLPLTKLHHDEKDPRVLTTAARAMLR